MTNEEYGQRLRDLRGELGLSLREVEERGGPSKDVLSPIERGMHKPRTQTLGKIAQAFGMSVSELRTTLETDFPKAEPLSPEWALSTADDDSFRRAIEGASTERLRGLVVELAVGLQPPSLDDLRREGPEEGVARVKAGSAINIIAEELLRRGEEPPERYVLAWKRFADALAPPEEAPQHEEREGQEAG